MIKRFRRTSRRTANRPTENKRSHRPLAKLESLEHRLLLAITDLNTATTYATIQDAVNGANPGDTILVDAGTYAENVNVNKSLVLEGAQHGVDAQTRSGAETTLDGTTNGGITPFDITANNVTIDGFTVQGATSPTQFGYGIVEGAGTSGTQILNNIIQDNIAGLALSNATGGSPGLIQHNLFQDNNESGPVSGTAIYTDQFVAGGNLANVTIDSNSFLDNQNAGVIIGSTDAATSTANNVAISNNLFTGDASGNGGNAVLLFNTTSSSVTDNTMTDATATQLVIGGGDNGVQVTNNIIQDGATRGIRIGDFGGGSTNQNVTINYNNIQGNALAGLEIDSAAGAYTGTLDASKNWWGDISGPTIASNVGGLGQTIVDPNSQITFAPWLIYNTDADPTAPGFQLPLTVPVASLGDVSPAVNDFTLLQNAIGAAATGQTIDLSGNFDWTATNSAAAYAASTNTAPTADIRGVALPDGVNNLTITSSALNAKIMGGGDSTDGIFNGFVFSAVNPGGLGNNNLAITDLNIDNFKSGVMLGWNNGGMFNGTFVQGNTFTVAADNDNNAGDVQGIAVYFWNGQNQIMSGNTIDFMGDGTRTTGTGARSYGFQDGTTGGTGYNGLSIDNNIFQMLPSAIGGSEVDTGIWENGHNDDNASHIAIDNNQFLGIQGQRLFDIGLQLSSQTTNMLIDSNTFTDVKYVFWVGAHNGDVNGDQFTFTNNVLTRVGDASGVFLQNVDAVTPATITINWNTNNTIDGFTGIRGLNELSTQATAASRPTGAATDLNAVNGVGSMPVDFVNTNWGSPGRFTNPLTTPDGTPGPIAFGFNTFTTVQDGVNAVDVGGTTNVLPGTYAENVIIAKDITLTGMALDGTTALPPTAIIQPAAGDGITIGAPATDVTVGDLEITGAATGIVASNLTTLNLSDLTLTGNTVAGGTLTNIGTVNDTPLTGSTGATDTITGSSIQRDSDQAINYSGVTNLNVTGSDGSDTFNVTPAAATTISVDGGLPTPPATPGDTLNVDLSTATGPSLTNNFDPVSGYFGTWTFTNAMPVTYSDIETLANVADLTITKSDDHGGDSTSATTGSAVPGTSLTYTIVVTNTGVDDVTGASVDDTFPADFTGGSYTATEAGGASGFTASGSGDIHDTVDMPVGSTVTYVVTGTISTAATGTLSNIATVTAPAGIFDNNTANNTATDDDTLTPTVDLTISKTDNSPFSPNVPQGTTFQYTITVGNTGPSDVTGAAVTDPFPANFVGGTYTASATGGATGFTAAGAGDINDTVNLPAGSTITYVVTGMADLVTTGPLDNTATITAPAGVTNTNPSNTATDNLTETVPVGLLITKTDDHGGSSITATPGSVTPGTMLTYTITVSNIGGIDVSGATVADAFPADFTGAGYTTVAAGGASDSNPVGSGDISDTVNLPAGGSITYTVFGTVSASATGTLSNTATVTPPAGFTDTAPTNDTATDTDTLTPSVDITVAKTDDHGGDSTTATTGSVVAGTTLSYTIVVSNTGPSDVTGATISDAFPADFTGANFTATESGGASGFSATGSGDINDTVNLPAGSSITYLVAGTVASSTTGTLSNTANVGVPAGVTNSGASSATDTDNVTAEADISVAKTDDHGGDSTTATTGSVAAGTALTYTVVVSNTGPSDVTGVTVTDAFPADFTGATYTATATGGATGFTPVGSGDISDGVKLPAGSSITYVVTGTISSSATGTLSNTATATAPAGVTDPDLANNSATDTDTLTAEADITVAKTDDHGGDSTTATTGSVVAGTSLTYTIVVSNTGPSDVTGATISDAFPSDFTGASFTATETGGASGFSPIGSGDISDTVDLPAGSSITYVVMGTVASSATGTLSNTANVGLPAGVTNTGASSATDTDNVTGEADITVAKTDDHGGDSTTATTGSVVAGTSLTYTIVVSNTGPSDVTGATVSDPFPSDFTGASFTATETGGASGFTASGSGHISDTVNLPAGSSITYVVTGTVASSATGTLSNTANVGVPAGVTNTGASSATDDDTVTAKADITVAKTDDHGGDSTTATTGSVAAGASLTYTVVVGNTGPSDVTGATITDAFPANFTVANFTATETGGASGFTSSGTGNISDTADLPAGSTITYVVTGTVAASATGTLSNTANVGVPAGVTNTGATSATDTDHLTAEADITVAKTDNHGGDSTTATTGSVIAGTTLTYTVVVSNTGPSDVTGATISDAFPADFTAASFTATQTGGASGFTASGSGNISDTVDLPAGSTITYVVAGTVAASATGTLSNTANVGVPAGVTNTGATSATDNDTVVASADISVTKKDNKGGDSATSTVGSVVAGTSMTYTIVVGNTGPSNLTGATISDAFPAGFTAASFTATATGGASGFTASGSGNISDTVNLPAGSSITYVVTGTVAASATGTLSNTANVGVPAGATNTGNASATDSDTVTKSVDLTVSKKDNKGGDSATSTVGSVVAGTSMTYTIVVGNTGPSNLTGATISDAFPAGFTAASFTATETGGASGFTASGSGNISDTVNLPAGSSITYVVTGTVAASATGTLTNTANVGLPAGVTNTGNASATDSDTVTRSVDLTVSKKDNKGGDSTTNTTGSVVAGSSMTYTIVVSNTGPSNVTGAAIADSFPANFTGAAFTASATGGATGFTASGSGNISDTVNLPAGGSITYVITGTVATSATGTLSNTANITLPAGVTNSGNASATDTDTITPAPAAPTITSANSADFAEGSLGTFTVMATGTAPITLTESGTLPTNVTFVDNHNGTATLSGTPPVGTAGVYHVTITAHNGVSPDFVQPFTLTVSAAVIQSSPFGYLAGVPGDGTIDTFVHNLYRELLGREPDASGLAYWVSVVQQNDTAAGREAVIQAFMNSPEYKDHYVTTLYQVFLGRSPEAGGLEFWTGVMGNPGTAGGHNGSSDEKFVLAAIVGSDEFYLDAGGTAQGFTNALYQDLLGRLGDSGGVDFWSSMVQAAPNDRDGIVRSFLTTPEATHKLLDSFYPAPGGTASNPLPPPGSGVAAGSYDLAVMTGDGWENLFLQGPFDSQPQGNDQFFAELAAGAAWDDIQLQLLFTDQYYTNPNRPVT